MDIHDLIHRLRELAAAMDAAGTLYAHDLIGQAADALEQRNKEAEELRGALKELRIRLHAAGRRPQECYEMSLIDDALMSNV